MTSARFGLGNGRFLQWLRQRPLAQSNGDRSAGEKRCWISEKNGNVSWFEHQRQFRARCNQCLRTGVLHKGKRSSTNPRADCRIDVASFDRRNDCRYLSLRRRFWRNRLQSDSFERLMIESTPNRSFSGKHADTLARTDLLGQPGCRFPHHAQDRDTHRWLNARQKRMGCVTRDDQKVGSSLLKAARTGDEPRRWIGPTVEKRFRAIGDTRVSINDHVEMVLIA